MEQDILSFQVSKLSAHVPEGVPLQWQGKTFNSGPLIIELDQSATDGSRGTLDYLRRRATAEFHVLLKFPEFANLLESLSVDAKFTEPIRAVLRSEGDILEDHSFQFTGPTTVSAHPLFDEDEAIASVMPGT